MKRTPPGHSWFRPNAGTNALVIAAILLCANASAPLASGIPLHQDDQLEDIGQYSPPWFAELQDVELIGTRAYVFGVGGMAIFDVSDPTLPIELGRYEPVGHPYNRFYRGAILGNLACAGGRADLLTIMDITTPAAPIALSVHGLRGQSYEGATMRGSYIYACRHADGLEVVDISNPALPFTAGSVLGLTNSWDIELLGNTAYIADGMGGLAVVDITNPTAPVLITTVATSGAAVDVTLNNSVLVVCTGSAGLDIFDLANPLAPSLVSTVNTSGLAITASLAGNLVYVADWDDVETYDLTNPAFPVAVGGEDTPVRAMGLDASPDLVVVADWSRVRLYHTGPSLRGDLQVPVDSINLGFVPLGATVDTTIIIANTGGAPLTIDNILDFGANFEVLTPGPLVIPVGGTAPLTVSFTHLTPGFESTFIRINSQDSDEGLITFPISADDNPFWLNLGDIAPDWNHPDRDGVFQHSADYRGRVVVMAFFADW